MPKIEVGQKVAVQLSDKQGSTGWVVDRITPKGQIVIRKGEMSMRFTETFREVGGEGWLRLDHDVAAQEILLRHAKRACIRAIRDTDGPRIAPSVLSNPTIEDLESAVRALRDLVDEAQRKIDLAKIILTGDDAQASTDSTSSLSM